jgi:hypothetical protein
MAPCRCEHCRAAYAAYRAQRRATGADPDRVTHGTDPTDAERHIFTHLVPPTHL